jgi:hypothetical protein
MHRDQLHIASPCSADWGAMRGDGTRRFCDQCRKHVHDLSAMTEKDAAALVAENASICVRYTASAEGAVRHSAPRSRWSKLLAIGAALVSTPALASGVAAQPPPTDPPSEPTLIERVARRFAEFTQIRTAPPIEQGEVVRMGDIDPPPPPPPVTRLGRVVPPTVQDPVPTLPATTRLPRPPAGSSVIPEVEEALDRQD